MKKLFDSLRTPTHERIELAVKKVADCAADVSYHRYMHDYYYEERTKITPQASAANAYEYARLFGKQEEHQVERTQAERKHAEAQAKVHALRKAHA